MLRRDRQRDLRDRDVRGPGARPAAAPGVHHVRDGTGQQALPGPARPLPVRPDHPAGRVLRRPDRVPQRRGGARRHPAHRVLRRVHLHARPAVRGVRVLRGGRGRRVRLRRDDRARRGASQQHQRRAALRGLHARHEPGDRERPAAAPPGRRLVPGVARGRAHLRPRRGRLPPGQGRGARDEHGLGDPGGVQRADHEEVAVAVYKGFDVAADPEHAGYFEAAGRGELVVQRCAECGLLRGQIGAACPFCTCLDWAWEPVAGTGVIYSYQVVARAVSPAFADWVPYPVVLVELDEQRGVPWRGGREDESVSLRKIANLVARDDPSRPEDEANVAIGLRVRVCFTKLDDGLALPQFRLTDEPPEHDPWRAPERNR
ncbi:hypothetical protein FXF69_31610 [Actinomadura chibensis]|uniref:ChsH2 C-terminal OB-fold domain-containing protein n=1 Tax=Actinomadura chibensis TaxID=392828 RepID=A0A5D0NDT2_9ACTN|nr:hypothetical protein FXF69_31610 [Actinomadura chibensis]